MRMKIGIIGTGTVGQTLGTGLKKLNHDVMIGSRNPQKEELQKWVMASGGKGGTFAEAAAFGEMIFICTSWEGTENAIKLAESKNFKNKIVIDVTNPLDFSQGMPPKMALGHTTSGGEKIQSWLPDAKVVKAFNIITAAFMIDGKFGNEQLDMFIAGNDAAAKKSVTDLLTAFHWTTHDLGGIEQSRILEYFAMLWITYGFKNNIWNHAFKLVRK